MSTIVQMPTGPQSDLLVGPFERYAVQVDGRIIPRLSGFREGDKVWLVVDGRFSAGFAEQDARQAAWLVAQALAIGSGYSHLGAETKDEPFAPMGMPITLEQ